MRRRFRNFLPLLSHCTLLLICCYSAKSFPFLSLFASHKKPFRSTLLTTTTNNCNEAADASYTLRLASWNLLAPLYATPMKYASSSPLHLKWDFRQDLIVQQLKVIDADILCLQEVQTDLWPELQRELEMLGYTQVCLQNVTRNHPVTVVTLLRDGVGTFSAVESRSRALITAIELNHHERNNNKQKTTLFLANVHLEAGMKENDNETRFFQIRSLLNRLKTHIQAEKEKHHVVESNNSNDGVDDAPLILVGDFNMLRDNPIHHLLINGDLPEKEMEELSHRRTTYLPLLPLRDAYLYHQQQSEHLTDAAVLEEVATYRGGYVLDYLWTSVGRIKIRETYNVEEILKRSSLLPAAEDRHDSASTTTTAASLMTRTTANMPRRRKKRLPWPDGQHPSDHLPIGATLELW